MAQYPAPIYEEVFNVENFSNLNSFQYLYNVAKTNISNSFRATQTFLNDVFIDAKLSVVDLNVVNTFLGYPVRYYTGLIAPVQQQFDSITTGGNVTIQSTVSVGPTITVSSDMNANVTNLGNYIDAVLQFEIPRGIPGLQGPQGPQGLQGIEGPQGLQGLQGPQGLQGIEGPQGLQGLQGPQGPQGLQGIEGPQGLQGPTGATGATGIIGATGAKGDRGDAGERGEQGEQGEQGDRGPEGKKGDSGADGNSTAENIASFFALSAVVVAVGIAVAAFMATSEFASKMTDLGYATYVYVDSKCGFFTSVGLEYLGYQQCNGSLKINNGVFNTVVLSNDPLGKSEFGYDVQFDNNIICKSGIVNANDRSLAIISSEDLNLSSTGEDVNINARCR